MTPVEFSKLLALTRVRRAYLSLSDLDRIIDGLAASLADLDAARERIAELEGLLAMRGES